MWEDKNRELLEVGNVYKIPRSDNSFLLIKKFDLNAECFERKDDKSLHFGREFIAYDEGKCFVDVYT